MGTALLAVALVGCSSDDTSTETGGSSTTAADSSTTAPTGPTQPDGTYVSDEIKGHELVEGSAVTMTFTDGQLSVNAGCNTISTAYTIDGDQIVIDGQPAMTMMGCEQDLADQDTWLSEWLVSGLSFTIDGDLLVLTGGDVTMALTAEASGEDGTIEGSWTLETVLEGESASSVPAGIEPPTLEFTGETVNVFSGCNNGSGEVTVTDSTITFGPIAMTMMACEGDAGTIEATVTGVLIDEVPYTLEDGALTLGTPELSLVYVKS